MRAGVWSVAAALVIGCSAPTDEEVVAQWCELEVGCFPDDWNGQADCEAAFDLSEVSDEDPCGAAIRDLVVCLSKLDTCQEADDYWNEPTPDYPCAAEDDEIDAACATTGTTPSTGS